MLVRILSTTLLMLFLLTQSCVGQKQNLEFLEYIRKYHKIAIEEMERAGIPASIKLAQGLLESNAGRSYLAKRGNNHFGIKCGSNWPGKKVYREDDDYDERGKLIKSCFRSYRSVAASYIAHSEFLRDPRKESRYGFLFRLRPTDYRRWAQGLKRAGYATSATYAEKLIDLIDRYELYKYDRMSTLDLDTPSDAVAAAILSTNDVKYTMTEENETLADIARRTDVAVRNILKYNEVYEDSDKPLAEGSRVYIQPKRGAYRGRQIYHQIKDYSDNMASISQRYGIKLSKLYKRNRMTPGTEPAIGQEIKIRGRKVKNTPRLRRKGDVPPPPPPPKPQPKVDTTATSTIPPSRVEDTPIGREEDTLPEISPEPNPPMKDVPSQPIPDKTPPQNTEPANENPSPPSIPKPVKEEKDPLEEDVFGEDELSPDETPSIPKPPASDAAYHTVSDGDTLWNISRRYGTTVAELKKLNKLNNNNIKKGMRLRVK
ncbi:MAG: LysM peptidoglycan-binding domain-containing protein [Saprospiraceae bacterium]|nr:LysM peptidoglycan-binding domain-containing protein [Saprospiraceae bacterium]